MKDLWGYDDGEDFVYDKDKMPNMYRYLSSATKDTITLQQKKIMDSLLYDAFSYKNSQDFRDYKRLRRMAHALYGILISTAVISSVYTYVNSGYFSPEGMLAVMFYGVNSIEAKYDEYKKIAERIAPYGVTPKEFIKLVRNKKLMEVYRTATYCQMYENDPFKSTLLSPFEYTSPSQEYVFIRPDGTTTKKTYKLNEVDEFYDDIRDMLMSQKQSEEKDNKSLQSREFFDDNEKNS